MFLQLLILIFFSSRFSPTLFFIRIFLSSKKEPFLLLFWTFIIAFSWGKSEEKFSLVLSFKNFFSVYYDWFCAIILFLWLSSKSTTTYFPSNLLVITHYQRFLVFGLVFTSSPFVWLSFVFPYAEWYIDH